MGIWTQYARLGEACDHYGMISRRFSLTEQKSSIEGNKLQTEKKMYN